MYQNELELPAQQHAERPTRAPKEAGEAGPLALRSAPREVTAKGLLRLQRAAGNAGVAEALEADTVKQVVGRGGGEPLQPSVRAEMEGHLGADLSDVRIHTGPDAAASAQAVQAHAYTVGSDVVFRDASTLGTDQGKRMLAHELTHVVQQRSGPVDGTPMGNGLKISDPSDRFERAAEESADRFMSRSTAEPSAAPSVQRQDAHDEEVQTFPVQRQEEDEAESEDLQTYPVQRQEAEETEGEDLQTYSVQRQEGEEAEDESLG